MAMILGSAFHYVSHADRHLLYPSHISVLGSLLRDFLRKFAVIYNMNKLYYEIKMGVRLQY